MKINVFLSLISIILTALLGYWIFDIAKGHEHDVLCGICSSVCLLSTLLPVLGLQYNNGRIGVNARVLSSLFFVLFLISHFCFAIWGVAMPDYIIVNGILLAVFLTILYKMVNIKEL